MRKIIADSSCNITNITTEGVKFETVPIVITIDEKDFIDDGNINVKELMQKMKQAHSSSTACPSPDSWVAAAEDADEIIIVTVTGSLSGSYNSAMIAKQILEEDGKKVCVIDSQSAGPGMELLIEKIAEDMEDNAISFEDIGEKANTYVNELRLYFILFSVKNLANNGRIPKMVASAFGTLGLSVIGTAKDGRMKPIIKTRGERKAAKKLCDAMQELKNGVVYIHHNENLKLAKMVKEMLSDSVKKCDIFIREAGGLCSYYLEEGGIMVSFSLM